MVRTILFVCVFTALNSFLINAQEFTEYELNPVIDVIEDPAPDEEWTSWKTDPYLIGWIGDSLRMYYGTNHFGDATQIGTAVSADGNNWIENRDIPVVPLGPDGTWDGMHVETPGVIHVPSNPDSMKYMLYYSGIGNDEDVLDVVVPGLFPSEIVQMGMAYSADGINFTKYNDPSNDEHFVYSFSDPVMKIPFEWDGDGLPDEVNYWFASIGESGPMYDEEDELFKMWFIGLGCPDPGMCDEVTYRHRVLYAESEDGINWSTPILVLDIGEVGDFDSQFVYAPHVIKLSDEYWMFYGGNTYRGTDFSFFTQEIGLAKSSNDIEFVREVENPIINRGEMDTWNNLGVNYPASIVYDNELRVYYSGMQDSTDNFNPQIGYSILDSLLSDITEFSFSTNNIYPNPADNFIQINGIGEDFNYTIYSLTGEVLLEGEEEIINVSDLPAGSYVLNAVNQCGAAFKRKFIKN